jgi:hypothetical protein
MAKKKKQPKYQIKRRTPFNDDLLPVIQNLTSEGRSLADIGMLLGYAGKSPVAWMRFLKNKHPEVADALEAGAKMADTKLIVTAFDASVGYDVEEEEIEYINNPLIDSSTGKATARYIEKNRKVKRKHIKPDTSLLFKLLCNRLPEYFSDIKKFEVNKQSINASVDMNKEIASFAGKLMKASEDRRQVESKEIDVDSSSTG